MTQLAAGNLTGTGVLVTRPAHQSHQFIDMLQQAGAEVIACPTIEIQPLAINDSLQLTLQHIAEYDILIFISANAVTHALKWLAPEQIKTQVLAAIGQGTTRELSVYGLEPGLYTTAGSTSEQLLEHKDLQQAAIAGKRILIFRGEGGREQLANTLTARGAQVHYAEVYRRTIPRTNIGPILEQWANGAINLITVTSNQTLENLYHLLSNRGSAYLNTTALIVPGKRCYELARLLGHKAKVQIASSAMDKDMFQAVLDWHSVNNKH